MKVIELTQSGDSENLQVTEAPNPTPQPGEVLIRVKAISINPVDVKTRKGGALYDKLRSHRPLILGWDISGEVTEVGSEVSEFKAGDAVFGMVNFPGYGQAYAEYVTAPADHLAIKPDNITHEEAAAATLAALTAWQVLTQHAKIQSGNRALIHAASGGVGHFAVQMAKHLGAYVIGTSSAANRDFVLGLGADEHVDYQSQSLTEAVSDIDFVLDAIGGDNTERSLEVMNAGGTIVCIPSSQCKDVKEKAAARGMAGLQTMVESSAQDMQDIAELLRQGTLKAHVSQTFAFDEMPQAHQQIETGHTVGKVVIVV